MATSATTTPTRSREAFLRRLHGRAHYRGGHARCGRPDRRSGPFGHRGGPSPADRPPAAHVRDPGGPRRDRGHVGPVPLPGHPLGLGHVHARLPVPTVDAGQGDRRRRFDPALPAGDGRRTRDRPAHPVRAPGRGGGVVVGAAALDVEVRADEGETERWTCAFLYLCSGYYRYDHGYTPDIPGLAAFAGPVVHPQEWPDDLDVAGRRVVVIGSGATAVTLVPALTERGAHVTMLQRSPSWMIALPGTDRTVGRAAPTAAPAIRQRRGEVEEHPDHAGLLPRLASIPVLLKGAILGGLREGARAGSAVSKQSSGSDYSSVEPASPKIPRPGDRSRISTTWAKGPGSKGGPGLWAFRSVTTRSRAAANSSLVIPVAMISAIMTSLNRPRTSTTSSRDNSAICGSPQAILRGQDDCCSAVFGLVTRTASTQDTHRKRK